MWANEFFSNEDKRMSDKCPVCKFYFGQSYLKTFRVYFCEECQMFVEFYPFDKLPKMIKKQEQSNLDAEISYDTYNDYPPEELPPGPRFPPWWV